MMLALRGGSGVASLERAALRDAVLALCRELLAASDRDCIMPDRVAITGW